MTRTTLLIANRGEIALRVMRTARELGMRTVALVTDADRGAPHTRAAEEVREVPSYLDIEAVVAAARAAGADLVHPGYGFLSERAEFARALSEAGITLVGPSAAVMEQMGRKDRARDIAVAAGVPVVPTGEAAQIGFPVLVKAAAGGGGKGMRVVRSAEELDEALAAARREASSAFGDDTMLIEKYVESGRHIEVQVMADRHGTVLHFFERDCSTQRRHQKVLEEAPAPTLTETQRAEITAAAVALAREVGYEGAGTVEFLLDAATGEFYFLEMNTRLQVEHPVTELVTGHDLVACQLRVALGEPLGLTQDEITLTGHAIEARVYAEDSFAGFLPQAGTAEHVRWPGGVRVDAALESGQEVSTAYDPMLGKLIAHGATREEARRRLVAALDETVISGLTTNAGFLRVLLELPQFRDATLDTAWLDRNEVGAPEPGDAEAALAADVHRELAATRGAWRADGFRVAGPAAPLRHQGRLLPEPGLPAPYVARTRRRDEVVLRGQRFVFDNPDPFAERGPTAGEGTVLAPMPGTMLEVRVEEGERVSEGQTLGVLEAMKMELQVRAAFDGVITQVGAATGDRVPLGRLLFEVSADA